MGSNTVNDVQNTETTSPAANKVSRDDMATTAASKVFKTVELLEIILLDLNFTTLLTSQATSKTLNSTIAESPKIQEKFFYKPPAIPSPCPPQHPAMYLESIKTPEGYQFTVEAWSGDIHFEFHSVVPTPKAPATGSWRRMHVHIDDGSFHLMDFGRGSLRSVEPRKTVWTLGEALDKLVRARARTVESFGFLWEEDVAKREWMLWEG